MILVKEIQRQQEKVEEERQQAQHGTGAGAGQRMNAASPGSPAGMGSGKMQGETIEYINESAIDDG